MKYSRRIPPTDHDLSRALTDAGWVKIKEPPNLPAAFSASIPFLLFNLLAVSVLMIWLDSDFAASAAAALVASSWEVNIRFDKILYVYLAVLFHEFLHLVLVPGFIYSDKTYFGIKPWGGFVATAERMSKRRFIVVSLGPFVLLSVVLPVLLGLMGWLTNFLVFLVFLNAMASSVDSLNAFLVFSQVPSGSRVVSNGFETYYRC